MLEPVPEKKGKHLQMAGVLLFILLLVYQIPVFPIDTRHIVGIVGWMFCFFHLSFFYKVICRKEIVITIAGMMLLFVYMIMEAVVNDTSFRICSFYLYWLVDIIPGICLLLAAMKENGISIFKLIYYAAIVESILAISAFFFPLVQKSFISVMTRSGAYNGDIIDKIQSFRVYGLSSGLFFDMPLLQCFVGIILLYLSIRINYKYIFPSVLLCFSGIINARIGLIEVAVGVGVIFIMSLGNMTVGKLKRFIGLISMCTVLAGLIVRCLEDNHSFQWIVLAFYDIWDLLIGRIGAHSNTLKILAGMVVIPEGKDFVLGAGFRTMEGLYGIKSDIGYINDIWTGGILYCIGKYSLYVYILICIRRKLKACCGRDFADFFFMFAISTMFVCNYKAQLFGVNCLTIFFMILFLDLTINRESRGWDYSNQRFTPNPLYSYTRAQDI